MLSELVQLGTVWIAKLAKRHEKRDGPGNSTKAFVYPRETGVACVSLSSGPSVSQDSRTSSKNEETSVLWRPLYHELHEYTNVTNWGFAG